MAEKRYHPYHDGIVEYQHNQSSYGSKNKAEAMNLAQEECGSE